MFQYRRPLRFLVSTDLLRGLDKLIDLLAATLEQLCWGRETVPGHHYRAIFTLLGFKDSAW